jgi:CheY-like chemotaxis protein/HPt (histidine-containing phosphotransfer) domain-containing protein
MRSTAVDGGQAALNALDQAAAGGQPFQLLLLDVMMPEMDGFAVAQEIQRRPVLASIPIIMLSSGGRQSESAYREAGVAGALMKPIKQSDLLSLIQTTLGAAAPGQPAHARLQAADSGARLRILLAEDHPVNQKLAVRLLEKQGHEVVVASTGREALVALGMRPQKEGEEGGLQAPRAAEVAPPPFDLVLMDVQMPEMGGFEATALIRAREKATGGHIPIIAMTAHAMKGDRERCLEAGMDGYVSKPIQPRELWQAIQQVAAAAGRRPVPETRQASSAGSVDAAEVLDSAEALRRVGDDLGTLRELVDLFIEDYPRRLADARAALAAGDARKFYVAAHTLKGAVGTLGGKAAYQAAARLEATDLARDRAQAEEACAALEEALEHLQPALLALVREDQAGTPPLARAQRDT